MINYFLLVSTLSVAFVLSGCGASGMWFFDLGLSEIDWNKKEQKYPRQVSIQKIKPLPDALISIKTIALLDAPNPHFYTWGSIFRISKIEATQGGFDFSLNVKRSLKKHLEAKGFNVISVSVFRDDEYELLKDYSSIAALEVDAILDLAPVEVGYKLLSLEDSLPHASGPHVSVVARLVSMDSKETIFAESIQYGVRNDLSIDGAIIESPFDYTFQSDNDLYTLNDKAIEQLAHGIDAVAAVIADRLSQK